MNFRKIEDDKIKLKKNTNNDDVIPILVKLELISVTCKQHYTCTGCKYNVYIEPLNCCFLRKYIDEDPANWEKKDYEIMINKYNTIDKVKQMINSHI
jgi:hypothetical protein